MMNSSRASHAWILRKDVLVRSSEVETLRCETPSVHRAQGSTITGQLGTSLCAFLVTILLAGSLADRVSAADWPMWRGDAGRTAAISGELPTEMFLQWTRVESARVQVWDDPLNHDLMQYDRIFEPVVKDGLMFVGFNDADKVVAIDTKDGSERWAFYADGPVRFAPVAWRDRIFFSSDDGHLYCVRANDGALIWKFRGGPSNQKVVGNRRVVSAWPARGGPVVHEGGAEGTSEVYFAASIWPFMGTFIYSLDPESGDVNWKNDSTAFQYIKQPHSAPSFAGVAPQGSLVIVGDHLLIPGGRSVPAAFDRHTGEFKYFDLNAGGKGNGGSFVSGKGDEFYVHTRQRGVRSYALKNGVKTAFMPNEPVLTDDRIYTAITTKEKTEKSKDGEPAKVIAPARRVIRAYNLAKEVVWEIEADGQGDLIKVGDYLFAANEKELFSIRLPRGDVGGNAPKEAAIEWTHPVDGEVLRLLAAGDQLFAVTLDGRILAFGREQTDPNTIKRDASRLATTAEASERAKQLAATVDFNLGYVMWFGAENRDLLTAFVAETEFQVVVVDQNVGRVRQLQNHFETAGLYGTRVTVHVGDPTSFQAPPYICQMVVLDQSVATYADAQIFETSFKTVRPYGGVLVALNTNENSDSPVKDVLKTCEFEKGEIGDSPAGYLVRRVGALPGAADWTHQYGNIANTVKSDDSRVKLPLGVLWFGGSSNNDVLPRHGHGPPEQVVGGRVFIEGMNSLSCRDVYTGQVFWKREFDDLGTYDIYYDQTYKDTPLDTAYNQVHIPGANGRGTNFVATADAIYLALEDACLILDVKTGETVKEIQVPPSPDGQVRNWGYIGVYQDVLLAGAGFANFQKRQKLEFPEDEKLSGNRKGYGAKSLDVSASAGLIAYDRKTGEMLWQIDALHSFLHNGIIAGDGKVFVLDKLPKQVEDKMKRRGLAWPDSYRIIALDYQTGEELWQVNEDIFGTWLGYSEQNDLLLQAGASASDRLYSEVGDGMATYHGKDGSLVWKDLKRNYSGPCILHNDTILTNANSYQLSSGAFSLLTGEPKLIVNPLTGEEQTWQLCRAYGCNSIIASENLLTFRSGAAGFYDMTTLSGTGNLGGFKSSCTSNLVVANGVLNAPDYTRTCSCSYQNQTSLALIHMPQMEMWTINNEARLSKPGQKINRVGINFGAPGDRMDETGTLWIDFPVVGGESAEIEIDVEGDSIEYFNRHSFSVSGKGLPWVGASGVMGPRRIVVPMNTKPAPTGLRFAPADPSDDGEEATDGGVNTSSSDLELVKDDDAQVVGIRFPNIDIAQGIKIQSAYIQFTCDETSDETTTLRLRAEAASDADAFREQAHNISQRPVLGPEVTWKPKKWSKAGEAGENQRTPDLAAILQAVVDQPDWAKGNAAVVIIDGEGKRVAEAFSSSDRKSAARLIVEADVPPEKPKTPPPAIAHTVRLHFVEPDAEVKPGSRVFAVSLQGESMIDALDIANEAGGDDRLLVKEFRDVMISEELVIELAPQQGSPVISGIEIVRQ